MCWISVLILIAPVAVCHGVKSSNPWIYTTDNSTTVCQGLYWFMVITRAVPEQDIRDISSYNIAFEIYAIVLMDIFGKNNKRSL
jgi:hypothetical protein